ncbi:hypothetical protein niasHT_002111 [Heterodera trifolii]|uniref:Uncharacterized protein n=1 Tax=Heterodera trifolii TaxID=157864 RepID=A0ABD2MDK5_9BILA
MFTPNVPYQTHLLQSVPSYSSTAAHHQSQFSSPAAAWTATSASGVSRWSQQQQQNNESLIRKHRSLEGVHQLLVNNPSCSSAPSMFPPPAPSTVVQQFSESLPSSHHHYHLQHNIMPNFNHLNGPPPPSLLQPLLPAAGGSSSPYFGGGYAHVPQQPTTATTTASIATTTTAKTAAAFTNDSSAPASRQFFSQPTTQHHHSLWMPSSSGTVPQQHINPWGNEGMAPIGDVEDGQSSLRIDEDDDGFQAAAHLYQPVSAHAILQQVDLDPRALRRELASLCDRFNYLAGTVRNFWAPELRRERHRWREQWRRSNELEQRLNLMRTETQMLSAELKARRDEQQQQQMGQPRPRDFTETSYTMHEWQTLKAKLERSELSLADRTRMLGEAELRAKGAEEQKAELERRNECLSRTLSANEAQLKLLQEDLDMLRGKLETKNQLLDTRDRERKRMEAELEMSRAEVREQEHRAQESDRRVAQLTHQIDQLERDARERDMQLERLRKRMQDPAAARAEAVELQQKLDNAVEDRARLEQLVDQLRAHNDAERLQQLEQFKADREHMEMSIQCLKKELADRHVLISSQNEKISQLDNAIAKQQQLRHLFLYENGGQNERVVGEAEKTRECMAGEDSGGAEKQTQQQQQYNELDRTRHEMDRLLERVRELEREKRQRQQRQQQQQHVDGMTTAETVDTGDVGKMPSEDTASNGNDEQSDALKHRIHELEEALRESVGITSEREKALAEQKKVNQKLSDQVTELFEAGGGALTHHQRQLREALNALAEARNRLEEERLRNQRMLGTVRKELGMALVAEKESAIALVQCCYGPDGVVPHSVRERLEQIHRQKERLRHALLASTTATVGTTTAGGDNQQQQHQQQQQQQEELIRALGVGAAPPMPSSQSVSASAGVMAHHHHHQPQQLLYSQPISIQTRGGGTGTAAQQQQHPPLGISAPASLTYYGTAAAAAATVGSTTINGIQQHQTQQQIAIGGEFGTSSSAAGGGGIISLVDDDGIWA